MFQSVLVRIQSNIEIPLMFRTNVLGNKSGPAYSLFPLYLYMDDLGNPNCVREGLLCPVVKKLN